MKATKELVILAAKRTPFGGFGGCLKALSATDLGVIAAEAALEESGIDTKQPLFFIGKNTRMVCGQIWYFYHLDLLCTRNQ